MRPRLMLMTLGAVVCRVADASGHGVVGADEGAVEDEVPLAVEDLDRHQAHVEGHARAADPVVGELADGARHVGAVARHVEGQLVVPDEIAGRHEALGAEVRGRRKRNVHRPERRGT